MSETARRGEGADWRQSWPVRGIKQGDATPSAGVDALRAEGFGTIFDVEPIPEDADEWQDHLNNTAAVRMFNDLRIAYVATNLAPDWPRWIRRNNRTVVVRELHVQYDSEGWVTERYAGAIRWVERRGKAGLVEERLVEASTARPLARAWIVHLLVDPDGKVEAFPDWFWERVGEVEGAPLPLRDLARTPWGPPP